MRCPECNSKEYRKGYGLGFYRYTCYCCGYESPTVFVGLSDEERAWLNELDHNQQDDEDYEEVCEEEVVECPNCGSQGLEIVRETDETIRYHCCQCGRYFEVDNDGQEEDDDDDD
ncbi:MAG: hypothetical protein IJK84_08965, partial [Bacteroidales bacterium]|nr:hypothetical protein [Bacteroidales bacterium]